jgi:hypothetical protein
MSVLIHAPRELQAQTAEDERVRAWWAKGSTHPITVYKTGMDTAGEEREDVEWATWGGVGAR